MTAKPWALYLPVAAIIVNTFLGLSADLLSIEAYYNPGFYQDKLVEISSQITIAWGWIMFFVNSLLTGSIVGRIVYVMVPAPVLASSYPTLCPQVHLSFHL
ncbi:hypothetical protein PHLCEN_2v10126 [Hermanssonia centrifuga]|uniref:Uncharacterized protein n=1 Tax=Hermanssonia centrifuga TaxID=98765 RepID=A0A2R6NNZ0_9APHY|nr:hypothetical protein PHLCEN_2v10126 [Hermanssonia centrifuga]